MKQRLSNFILIFILIIGLSLLLYPTISDWWNTMHQSRAIASYTEVMAGIDPAVYEAIRQDAALYNETLVGRDDSRFEMTESERQLYDTLLNPAGDQIMGIVEIPDIHVTLPFYHGTSEEVLQVAIGHIEGSSLPVGGAGSHCALSGHRGLPSARLFTDLDQLEVGDQFMLHVLDETLTYEVDRISIVKPYELEELSIADAEDYCTLVTCTPYGINSHRLLVRGTRITEAEEVKHVRVTADATRIDPLIVAPAIAVPILILLFLLLHFMTPKRKNSRRWNV